MILTQMYKKNIRYVNTRITLDKKLRLPLTKNYIQCVTSLDLKVMLLRPIYKAKKGSPMKHGI